MHYFTSANLTDSFVIGSSSIKKKYIYIYCPTRVLSVNLVNEPYAPSCRCTM